MTFLFSAIAGVMDSSGQADGKTLQQILERLEALGQQLNEVACGQEAVESAVREVHREIRQEFGHQTCPSPPPPSRGDVWVPKAGGLEPRLPAASSPPTATLPPRAIPALGCRQPLADSSPPAATNPFRARQAANCGGRPLPAILDTDAPPAVSVARASPGVSSVSMKMATWEDDCGFWPRKELARLRGSLVSSYSGVQLGSNADDMSQTGSGRSDGLSGRRLPVPVHPDSWTRAIFDSVSITVLLWDAVAIPYQLAWEVPQEGWAAVLSWATSIFWTFDLFFGFLTGYHEKENVVMGLSSIAKRYMATSFVPNFMVVVADIIGNMTRRGTAGSMAYIKVTRIIKLQRVLRLSRIMRHGKVALIWDVLSTMTRQWGMYDQFCFATKVTNSVVCIMWLNHVGGCMFYAVGKESIAKWYTEVNHLEEDDGGTLDYILGFYWSASAMIAGESVVLPQNKQELITTMLCVVFGFIVSSIVISGLIATVVEFQRNNKERDDMLLSLRQFLYQHKVDPRVAVPIVRQVDVRMCSRNWLAQGDVAALSLLTPTMQSQLFYSIYGPHLLESRALCALDAVDGCLVKDICFRAFKHTSYKPGSRVFEPAVVAEGVSYVFSGSLEYVTMSLAYDSEATEGGETPSDRLCQKRQKETARAGAWISEVALWVNWQHRGYLDATTACEVLRVSSDSFVRALKQHVELHRIVKQYSMAIFASLKLEPVQYLTDLHPPMTHQSVVAAMPLEERVLLSQGAMRVLESKHQWRGRLWKQHGVEELRTEIQNGDCDLMVDAQDNVHRVVTIVALRLRREEDGALLTQIGRVANGVRISSCQPPGSKVGLSETPQMAIARLMRTKLKGFDRDIDLGRFSQDVEARVSKKYGVMSKYLRTLFDATFVGEAGRHVKVLGCGRRTPCAHLAESVTSMASSKAYDPTVDYEAFVFYSELRSDADPLFIYAWLLPEDYQVLSRPSHAEILQQWIADLDFGAANAVSDSADGLRGAAAAKE